MAKIQPQSISVSPLIVVQTVLILLATFFLFYIRSVVVMLFASVVVMSAFNPAVSLLHKKLKVPRPVGIVLMYVSVLVILAVAIAVIVPPLIAQLQYLSRVIDVLPLQEQLKNFKFTLSELNGLLTSIGGSVGAVFSIITSTFSGIFTFFTVSVMSAYLLLDRDNLHKKISWFSRDTTHLKLAAGFIDSVEQQLGGWVRGQLILMVTIGLVTYVGLTFLKVPFALPLALLAGFLEILPNLGPTVAAVPAIILGYAYGGWVLGLMTLAFYIVVQQLENNLIVPKIMKDNADVNPLTTIVTILVGLKVGGVIGALLAVPVYIVLRSAYSLWLSQRSN